MTDGLTACEECGTAYEATGVENHESGLYRAIRQECPECGHSKLVGILYYPSGDFIAIGDAPDDEKCRECDDPASYVAKKTGDGRFTVCDEHVRSYRPSAVEFAKEQLQ